MSSKTKAEKQFTKAVKFYQKGDYVKSVKWLWKAADQGHARAQTRLGYSYAYGEGVTQSHPEAVKWYRLAADQGDARAQYNLGVMYANGKGVTQSYPEAAKLFRLAAEKGDVYAKYRLKELDAAK